MKTKILFDFFFRVDFLTLVGILFLKEKEINTSAQSINISFLRCLGILGSI